MKDATKMSKLSSLTVILSMSYPTSWCSDRREYTFDSSGLIDSLTLVQILPKLEDITQLRIPAAKVQPKDLDNVALMLATAARVGKPRH